MAEEPQRRVVVADARGNGRFLRVTWHPETGQFVVSQWRDDTCVASTRLDADAAGEVLAVLVHGLATRRDGDARGQAGAAGQAERRAGRQPDAEGRT